MTALALLGLLLLSLVILVLTRHPDDEDDEIP